MKTLLSILAISFFCQIGATQDTIPLDKNQMRVLSVGHNLPTHLLWDIRRDKRDEFQSMELCGKATEVATHVKIAYEIGKVQGRGTPLFDLRVSSSILKDMLCFEKAPVEKSKVLPFIEEVEELYFQVRFPSGN